MLSTRLDRARSPRQECRREGDFAPTLFGWLIESGSHWRVSAGYALAGVLLAIAAATELRFGVAAEQKSLESIASPLSSRG
jgi:hypothetical protein